MGRETDIAIIGMAGRYPKSESPEQLWQHLVGGTDLSENTEHQDERIGRHFPIDGIDLFDHAFFGFTPYEAQIMDPQHRVLLTCAYQAMERAGYDNIPQNLRVGVFASSSISTYLINNIINSSFFDPSDLNYAVLLGNDKDTVATRISYKLNLNGPAITVQCACSSSLVATHMACQSLLLGDSDMCIVGAASITTPQDRGYVYKQGGILSRDGYCRPFDRDASGTAKGNGCSVLLLRRLADAERDGNMIHAVIRSTAVNNDGAVKIGYTAPSVAGQQQVIAEALGFAGATANDVDYIETHGTGTELGDQIELTALASAFKKPRRPIPLGSLKANIGHLDVAAGITSIIKCVHAMQSGVVPAIAHLRSPTRAVAEACEYFEFPQHNVQRELKTACVSSFGIGGTNAHAIVGRYDAKPRREVRTLPLYLLPLSVNRQDDFPGYLLSVEQALRKGATLLDLSASLATRRKRRAITRCLVLSTADELSAAFEAASHGSEQGDLRIPRFGQQALETIIGQLPCISDACMPSDRSTAGYRSLYVRLLAKLGVLGIKKIADENAFVAPTTPDLSPADVVRLTSEIFAEDVSLETPTFPLARFVQFLASAHTIAELSIGSLYDKTHWMPTALPAYPLSPVRHWIEPNAPSTVTRLAEPVTVQRAAHDDDTLNEILLIWRELIGDDGITSDTTLWDAGADSLTAVEIISRINQAFKSNITLNAALSDKTPMDLTAMVLGREFRSSSPWITSVRSRSASAKHVFLLHPAGGSTFCYRSLNRYITDDLNLWSIDLPEGYQGYGSLHSLATRYAKAIRAQQPNGPYLLGGYSFGGNLAHEIARVLENDGCEVETIFMFDPHPPEAYNVYDGSELDYTGAFPIMMASYFKPERTEIATRESVGIRNFSDALGIARKLDLLRSGISDEDASGFFEKWKFSHNLLKTHRPAGPVAANLVVFIAREDEPALLLEKLKINKVHKSQWAAYSTGSMIPIDVDGDHFTMFSMSRHVKQLAGHFQTAVKVHGSAPAVG